MKIDTMKDYNLKFFWRLVDFKTKLPKNMFQFKSNFKNKFFF